MTSVRPAPWRIGQSIAVLGLLAGVAGQAGANTIMISYSGTGPGSVSMGLGSFSFADGLSTVNLSDLTAFSLSQSFNVGDSVVPEFRYGLGDLTAFSATLSAGQILTTLSLETGNVLGNPATDSHGRAFAPQAFKVTSLATGGASTLNLNIDTTITTGTVTQVSAVPEPSTLITSGLAGLIGLAYAARRGSAGGRQNGTSTSRQRSDHDPAFQPTPVRRGA